MTSVLSDWARARPVEMCVRRSSSERHHVREVDGAALLAFVLQNTESVRFSFLLLHFAWPLWLYTIVVAVVRAFVWIGLGLVRRHRQRFDGRSHT